MSLENKEVHTERIFINAELARRWLKLNIENNRPIAEGKVKQMARDMRNGKWQENGATIVFADTGELIDGQKRLTACIECGVGFWSLVAYGVKKDAFVTIDRNQARTAGQVLHLSTGIGDYNTVASALRWLSGFQGGIIIQARPSSGETESLLLEHPGIIESTAAAKRVTHRFRAGPPSLVTLCHYLFTRQDATLAELFFDSLATGAGLRENDPVCRLRERIIASSASTAKHIPQHELIALFFKAWIAEREQRTINNTLRWSTGESFPNIGPIAGSKMRPEAVAVVVKKGKRPHVTPLRPRNEPKATGNARLDQLLNKSQKLSLDKL